ncbi:unnamed protein product [Candida verbasci]|uniref:Uncharacterized protein n=1 Tax=Candida verbasci TaxID=1227364 RepID=A0A9W4TVQ3_9ASCO|nr:unnamed protein product [Candida verbasci]
MENEQIPLHKLFSPDIKELESQFKVEYPHETDEYDWSTSEFKISQFPEFFEIMQNELDTSYGGDLRKEKVKY